MQETLLPPTFTHRQILTIIGGLAAGLALASLDQTIVATALPTIVGEMGGADNISAVVTAYLLAETVSTPIFGKLSDVYGRRSLFRFSIVLFVVGSMLCGVAQELWQLIACRGMQGIGAGGLISMAFATLGDVVSPRERGRYTGWFSSVFAVSSVIGPLVGGFLTDHVSWRWIFYVNVPVGIVALVVTSRALRGLREPAPEARRRLDLEGAGLLVAGVGAVLLALEWGGSEHAWTSPLILALGLGGLGVLVLWVTWERRAEDPIVPLRLFRNDVVAVAGGLSFLLGCAMFGSVTYMPLLLQVVKDVSASSSGLLLVPLMGGVLVAATFSGWLITKTGRYALSGPLGFGVVVVGMALVVPTGTDTPLLLIFAAMTLIGVGVGLLSPPLSIAVQNVVDPGELGVATATTMFMRTIGASVGVAVFGVIFSSGLDERVRGLLREPSAIDALPATVGAGVRADAASALHPVFIAGTLIAVVGIVLATRLREVPLRGGEADVAADDDAAVVAALSP